MKCGSTMAIFSNVCTMVLFGVIWGYVREIDKISWSNALVNIHSSSFFIHNSSFTILHSQFFILPALNYSSIQYVITNVINNNDNRVK